MPASDRSSSDFGGNVREPIQQLASKCAECIQQGLLLATVRGDQKSLLAAAGIATVYDGLRAVLLLLNTPAEWHADTVARSMIESYADVAGLAAQPGYDRRMVMESHIQQRRLYAGLAKAGTVEGAEEKAAFHAGHVAKMRKDGVRRLSVSQRFEAANLPVDFRLIYADFSVSAHGDYLALHARHLGTGSVRAGERMTDYAFLKCAWVATAMAHGAAALLPHFAEVDGSALEQTLAPAFGYEATMNAFRQEALESQARQTYGR